MKNTINKPGSVWGVILFLAPSLITFAVAGALASEDRYDSAFRRVDSALQHASISLEEAVRLQAQILYAPGEINKDSPFYQAKEAVPAPEAYFQELFVDVGRAFPFLSDEEKNYLAALSPALERLLFRLAAEPDSPPQSPPPSRDRGLSAQSAALEAMSEKEQFMLKARLILAPETIPPTSVLYPQKPAGHELSATSFIKTLNNVFVELTPEEKDFLRTSSPILKALIETREQQQARMPGAQGLPNFPYLDKTLDSPDCTIHYTLTDAANKAPNAGYPGMVAGLIESAIKTETPLFQPAIALGGGKLQVYILDTTSIDALGVWLSQPQSGQRSAAGFMLISNNLASLGSGWQTRAKGLVFHEYFHGIQDSYNFSKSVLWFAEGTAVWAEGYFAKVWTGAQKYYEEPDSIFNVTAAVIWDTSDIFPYRRYSTSALAFYFTDKYGGAQFLKAYLAATAQTDAPDAITCLRAALSAQKGSPTFENEYKTFLISLYNKSIHSIATIMPEVSFAETHDAYGVADTANTVYLTGGSFYRLKIPTDAQLTKSPLIATFTPVGTTGNPEGLLVAKGTPSAVPVKNGRSALPKVLESVFIATDVTYSGQDAAARTYNVTFETPFVKIDKVTSQSPITSGGTSNIHIFYDLLGTVAGQPFPFTVKLIEKGSDVSDNLSGNYTVPVGTNQDFPLYFWTTASTVGTYKFTYQLKVPSDDWGIQQAISNSASTYVVVNAPSGGIRSKRNDQSRGGPEIRR